ncbi:hypothetical protein SEA_NICEHOUSE_16 [Rhodococcus phage NiceHouse]|nr:hypothetical protein SEA_NICEHOUSE_16 [Rhodococcus phage NiceHouse]
MSIPYNVKLTFRVSDKPEIRLSVLGKFGVMGHCAQCPNWRVGSEDLVFSNTTFKWIKRACEIHKEKHDKQQA